MIKLIKKINEEFYFAFKNNFLKYVVSVIRFKTKLRFEVKTANWIIFHSFHAEIASRLLSMVSQNFKLNYNFKYK